MSNPATQNPINKNIKTKNRMAFIASFLQTLFGEEKETKDVKDELNDYVLNDPENSEQAKILLENTKQIEHEIAQRKAMEEKTFKAREKLYGTTVKVETPKKAKELSSKQKAKVNQLLNDDHEIER